MITEDYCSYELSKLLKEKGFDESCRSYYIDGDDYRKCAVSITKRNLIDEQILRPTHQMAMKWLREEYNIFIDIRRSLNTYLYGAIIRKDPSCTFNKIPEQFETYEDAVEAALKYCLTELINL